MAIQPKIKAAEFWEISQRSENRDHALELIDGEIVEVPSTPAASALALRIGALVLAFVDEHDLGYVTTTDGGYEIDDNNTFAPDAAFISKQRQPELPEKGFNPIPPDLVIEVVSPSDLNDPKRRIQRKLEQYKAAGVPLIWYFYYQRRVVEVHRPGQPVREVSADGVLDGEDVLPGFKLPLAKVFK